MITEDYCSFEVAKLLKEKEFSERSYGTYNLQGEFQEGYGEWNKTSIYYAAPTLQMAMKWLRKNHNILITIIPQEIKVGIDALCYGIYRITKDLYQPLYNGKVDNLIDSYKEAVEAALKYSLKNLI